MLIPASQDTTGAVEAGQLIVGYLQRDRDPGRSQAGDRREDERLLGCRELRRVHLVLERDPDPDYQLSVFTTDQCGDWSDGCWSDPTFDALYQQQRTILDRDERLKVVHEAQREEYEQVPGVVLAYPGWVQAYRSDRFGAGSPHRGRTAT